MSLSESNPTSAIGQIFSFKYAMKAICCASFKDLRLLPPGGAGFIATGHWPLHCPCTPPWLLAGTGGAEKNMIWGQKVPIHV